jgi:hypothetical protein
MGQAAGVYGSRLFRKALKIFGIVDEDADVWPRPPPITLENEIPRSFLCLHAAAPIAPAQVSEEIRFREKLRCTSVRFPSS